MSVVQLAETGNASVDPVTLRLVGRDVDEHDEVGGVSSRGEDASASTGLVDRTLVTWLTL